MLGVLFGIVVTYIAAPLAAYCLIAPAYRLRDDTPFRVLILAMGFGPIGISLLLFVLFTIAPGRSDVFYVGCLVLLILLLLIARWRLLKGLLALPLEWLKGRNFGGELFHLRASGTATPRILFSAVARAIPIIVALLLFFSFVKDLRPDSAFGIYGPYNVVAVIAGIVLLLFASAALIREVMIVIPGPPGAMRSKLSQVSQFSENNLGVVFGAVVTVILLAMVLNNGLTAPLINKDPIEYALMSRVIYTAKSLSIYPITDLPDSGLYSGSSHPLGYYLLQVWGYFFDGPTATRMLRLPPLCYFVNLILLMSVVLVRYSKLAAVLGGLFVLSIPFFQYLATMSHIDPMRIYFFFLSLVLVADIIRHPTLPRTIVCGVALGFSLYSHSLGIISVFIAGLTYFLLARNDLRGRLRTTVVLAVVGSIVGGSQYVKNLIQFGTPLLEHEPVWQIPELNEAADVAHRRMIGTPADVMVHGIFRNFTDIDIFGPISALALVLILLRARFLWRDDVTRVMLVACFLFFTIVVGLTLFGSLAAIKNLRYMMTIVPVMCFLAAAALSDLASKWWPLTGATGAATREPAAGTGSRMGPYFRSQGYMLIFMVLVVAWTVPAIRDFAFYSRPSLVWQTRDAEFAYDPAFNLGPLVRYFFDRPADSGKVLVFRQAEFAFYGRYPWVDHLDPVLVEFYQIKDKHAAYLDLLRRGIRYLYISHANSLPSAFYNSQATEIAADPQLAEIVASAWGAALFRLRDRPEPIPCNRVTPGTLGLEYHLPMTFWPIVQSILRQVGIAAGAPMPTIQRRESPFDPNDLAGGTHPIQRDQSKLSLVEFANIDVSSDAPYRGRRSMHIGLDVQGEGVVEILVASSSKAVATFAQANAIPEPGNISLWGALATFDDDGHLFYSGEKVGQVMMASNLLSAAFQGDPITFVFDPQTCRERDLGTLLCGVEYEARYDRANNAWSVTGPQSEDGKIVTHTRTGAEPTPGIMWIWGTFHRFDDFGRLFFLDRKVGTVRIGPRNLGPNETSSAPSASSRGLMMRALAGEPVTIELEVRACKTYDLGALQCSTPYKGRYDPKTNHWTLTGRSGPNATAASPVWSGVLSGGAQRVNVQTILPPYATRLNLVVRKFNKNYGSLLVRGIDLCHFREAHLQAKE